MSGKRIYVAIASYRDPLLQSTIDSAFASADFPENLVVGCFVQVISSDPNAKAHEVLDDFDGAVHSEVVEAGELFSVAECRNRALQWLTDDIDFVLQIDSHMRFEYGWDTELISALASTADPKGVLSAYLCGWYPIDASTDAYRKNVRGFTSSSFNDGGSRKSFFNSYELVPNPIGVPYPERGLPPKALRGWYLAGHFTFGPREFFEECKQATWILFWGEELFHSLRAFTLGWNVYTPWYRPLFHMFPQDVPQVDLNKIWKDFPDRWWTTLAGTTDRIMMAVINNVVDDNHLFSKRPLEELYDLLGYRLDTLFKEWQDEYRSSHQNLSSTTEGAAASD